MHLELSDEQRELRDELRAYLRKVLTSAERRVLLRERHGGAFRELVARLGSDGWLGLGFPVEYGGRGLGPAEQQIFVNETARADVPLPAVTLQTVAPTLLAHGTDEQRRFFLPRILAGEIHFAIGYTEPEAGTDLAALRTRAVRDGDEYVVDGQKTFTTGAHDADHLWLACRTAVDRHRGLSILIVDTDDPGYTWTPIITCDGVHHVNATYLSGIRVPVTRRVGAEGDGWRLITTQLNHERVMLGPAGRFGALLDRVREWAYRSGVGERADVRRALARTHAAHRVNELLNQQVIGDAPGPADASATKVFSSERLLRIIQELSEVVARHGDPTDPLTAELLDRLDLHERRDLVLTFGGGVNEIQREIIAAAGLGLPRVPR
ncbi:acyl-CoA dehydrogenase family protein [Actinoplanes couchii]|uniref:Acyl-CoA dehydrogenase n=1 Tax=Actinoplanes couchii TaxID=403638 RepID=A0ABQ3XF65_9ACTN|nr:acyl-CoA dehydrogenase family protein [Actinoplanes couchii]MDR6321923.1 alkylation response protein AidB-like acyl-CoA dehydrogenase [Actinoplanes couchii]GID57122.1 acyl-CoA dehydrogenase [Actinoplanes couchii]